MTLAVQRRRFTVDDYYQMGKAGIFREDDRLELIDGEIVQMTPIGSLHVRCVIKLTRLFSPLIQQDYDLSVQNPIELDEFNQPQPDLVIIKQSDLDSIDQPVKPKDIFLLIEVGDTSVQYDKDIKIPLYAKAGIKEVWQIDLQSQTIITYQQPTSDGYQSVCTHQSNDLISPQSFPHLQFTVSQITNP